MGERISQWRHNRYLKKQFRRDQEEARRQAEQRAWDQRGIKRRTLLKGAIAAGVVAIGATSKIGEFLVALDQRSRKDYENNESTHLEILEICREWFRPEEGDKSAELFFTSPGIGIGNGYDAAREMYTKAFEPSNEKTTPMAYLITSPEGKKIPEVADVLLEAAAMGEDLSLYGQSNGTIVLFEALKYLKEVKNITLPIKRLIINCSPFDFEDAKQSYIEKLLGKLLVYSGYEPGALGKFLVQFKERWGQITWKQFVGSMLTVIEDAWKEAKNGGPIAPWVTDLRILVNSDLNNYDLSGILTEDTEVLFLYSEHDTVVYNGNSIGKYKEKFMSHGVKKEKITVKPLPNGAGHADIAAGGEAARSWIQRTGRRRHPDLI